MKKIYLLLLALLVTMPVLSQIQIGTGTTTNSYIPIYGYYDYSVSQQIVLQSEYADQNGIAGNITKIRWYVASNAGSSSTWNTWAVYIGHTTKTAYTGSTDWIPLNTATLVYDGAISPTNGQWMEVTLTTPFNNNGVDNLVVTVIDKKVGYTTLSTYPTFRSYTSTNRGLYAYQDDNAINVNNLGASSNKAMTSNVAQIQFVGPLATCIKPTGVTVPTFTTNTANLAWTASSSVPASGYQFEVRTSGLPGSGATGLAQSGTTGAGVVTATVGGLQSNTAYTLYVRANCGSGDFSLWTSATFTTLCDATNVPYTMPINDVTVPALPSCVIVQNVNNDNKTWLSYATPTGFTGKAMGYPFHATNAANDWFYTQGLNLTAGQSYRLRFKYRNSSSAEKLRVSYGTATVNTDMTNELFTVTTGTSAATVEKVIDFIPTTTGVFYIGFQAYSDANKNTLYVGDISVDLSPTCFVPVNVVVNNITKNSSVISWTAPATAPANGYAYEIRISGNPGETTGLVQQGTTAAGVTTATITQLLSSTDYQVYVRSVCSTLDNSVWTPLKAFKTLCDYPDLLTTTPDTICGVGQAELAATYTAGTVKWYAAATGGAALATGNTFTTPEISATTSYWVSSNVSGGANTAGRTAPLTNSTYMDTDTGLVFNVVESVELQSVAVYSTAAGTINVKIVNSAGTELYATGNVNVTNGGITTPNIIPLNFTVPTGTGYRMVIKSYSGANLIRESAIGGFPYTGTDGNLVVTNGYFLGTSASYYYFYDIKYEGGCASPRTEVVATVTTPPTFTLSETELAICNGSSSDAVTVTAGASDYDVYTWSPATGVSGDAQNGWVFNPSVSTAYTLTASQSAGNLCAVIKELQINVNAIPEFESLPEEINICVGEIQELDGGVVLGLQELINETFSNGTTLPANWQSQGGGVSVANANTAGGTANQLRITGSSFSSVTRRAYYGPIDTSGLQELTLQWRNYLSHYSSAYNYSVKVQTSSNGTTWNNTSWVTNPVTATQAAGIVSTVINTADVGSSTFYVSFTVEGVDFGMYDWNIDDVLLTADQEYELEWSPLDNLYEDAEATIPYNGATPLVKVYYKADTAQAATPYTLTITNPANCSVENTVEITALEKPVIDPIANPLLFCEATNVVDITVNTNNEDNIIKWYASLTATAELTQISQSGTYYVQASNIACSSERMAVQITIVGAQLPTAAETQYFCDAGTVADLSATVATGFTVRWYDAVASTTPLSATAGLVNGAVYYAATYHAGSGCESPRIPVTAVVTPTPTAVPAQFISLCQTTNFGGLQLSSVQNATLKWYASATAVQPIASTANVTNGTYYVSQTVNQCESARSQIQITVYAGLERPAAGTHNICGSGTVADLTATGAVAGAVYNWYNSATSTTPLALNTALVSGVYYVSQSISGCESPRRSVTVRVITQTAPVVNSFALCGSGTVSDLYLPTATFVSYKWYATATSTVELAQNVALTTGTYYVSRIEYGCPSQRTAVSVTILDLPSAPTGAANQSFTVNTIGEATIADLVMDQTNVVWYITALDAKNGTNPLPPVAPLVSGQTYYAVIIGTNGCPSLPTAITVDITLGVDDFDKTNLVYYPNPTADVLNIRYKNTIDEVIVYNLLGQKVMMQRYDNNEVQLDMSGLASGNYLLELHSEGQIQIIKIVKK